MLKILWTKVDASGGPYACWPWTGHISTHGYGTYGQKYAHRMILGCLRDRPLARGEIVRHRCDNPPCCNPTHLQIGTQYDNIQDRVKRGRGNSGIRNAEKTHCPQGHSYDEINTRMHRGSRECRTCHRLRAAVYRDRKRGI
jgi:hypothetical protein